MPPHLLAKHKMNFLYHSAVVLVLCEKRQPLQSGNLLESCREDVSLTLRKICYLLWMTKDAFRVQTIGSRELVSSLAGLDWEGDLQWTCTVKYTSALVLQLLLFLPCLWSLVYRLSGNYASGSSLLLSLSYPLFLPSSFCQQITMASLSLEATKPTRYLSFLLGAAVITLPGKVACFSLSVRKFTFLFGFVLF